VTNLPTEGEAMPRKLTVKSLALPKGARITLLGAERAIPWSASGTGFTMQIPARVVAPNGDAWVFRVSRLLAPS